MTELTFELKEGQPYIELNKILQILKVAQTGGHAKILIQNEEIKVNGETETRIRNKLKVGDIIIFEDKQITIN